MQQFFNKNIIVISILFAIGITMIPMLTDEAMATHRPNHPPTGGGNPSINDGAINYESGAETASATGSLVGAPGPSGPYTVVGSLDLSTTTSNTKTVGPNDRVIEPKGLQSEGEAVHFEGTQSYPDNENNFDIPLTTTDDTTQQGKTLPEQSGFQSQTTHEVVGSSLTLNGQEQPHETNIGDQ